ncbi:hypothetical protein HYT25_00525 [Candidatus Pacearchaeota archaeon]|nr:hypothetical protein [Candidatus Pacearchaeota archaeon]
MAAIWRNRIGGKGAIGSRKIRLGSGLRHSEIDGVRKAYHEGTKGYAQGYKKWKDKQSKTIGSSIKRGISAITEHHPSFRKIRDYLSEHIDKEKLYGLARRLYEKKDEENLSDEEKLDYLEKVLSDYVASGKILDPNGRRAILRKGLEEKAESGFFKGFLARRELKGEKYIDDLIAAFRNIDELFESEGHYDNMPKLKRSVKTIRYMGALREAMDVLDEKGVMNRKARAVVSEINRNIGRGYEDFLESSRHYSERYKVAASIFSIFGIGLLVSSGTGITGNIIGNTTANFSAAIAGTIAIIFALFLFWRSFKN